MPMPRVFVIPDMSPNAFATGRGPSHAAVAATEGILQVLNERELEGVIAHELTHVRNRDILVSSVAATIAAAIMMLARMAQYAALFGGGSRDDDREGGNPLGLLLTVILAPLAATLIQAAISRSREFAADAGAKAPGRQPLRPGGCAEEDRSGGQAGPARREPRHRAHVHHEAVLGPGAVVAVQHPPAHREADPGAAAHGVIASPRRGGCSSRSARGGFSAVARP